METPRLSQLLDLSGKVAVVTGAGMGIGQGIAIRAGTPFDSTTLCNLRLEENIIL